MPRFLKLRTRRFRRELSQLSSSMRVSDQMFAGAPIVLLSGGSPVDLDGSLFIQLGIFAIAFFMLRSRRLSPVHCYWALKATSSGCHPVVSSNSGSCTASRQIDPMKFPSLS